MSGRLHGSIGVPLLLSAWLGAVAVATPSLAQDIKIISRNEWRAEKPKPVRRVFEKGVELAGLTPPFDRKADIVKPDLEQGDIFQPERAMPARLTPAKYLTLHHTEARFPDQAKGSKTKRLTFAEQLRWHQRLMFAYDIDFEKPSPHKKYVYWGDTPYHFIVSLKGDVAEGRPLTWAAGSNTTYKDLSGDDGASGNVKDAIREHITVVLEGNFNEIELAGRQREALVALLAKLAREHAIPLAHIGYHRSVSVQYTDCPGANVIKDFENIRQDVAKLGIR